MAMYATNKRTLVRSQPSASGSTMLIGSLRSLLLDTQKPRVCVTLTFLLKRHVIKLGPGNEEAAKEAVQTWPDGLHVGGGINIDNAATWLEAGAQKVIVTSW